MEKIFVGIDPSLSSTAMCIDGNLLFNYAYDKDIYTKKGDLSKWFELGKDLIHYRSNNKFIAQNYSKDEIAKLVSYTNIVNNIVNDILENCEGKEIIVGIESYSFSSSAGPLIDLVTLGTILRSSIYQNVTKNITIFAPTSVKKETARLIYPENYDKKTKNYRNNSGVAGGSFKKHEMCQALIDSSINTDYVNFLRKNQTELLSAKKVSKPYEDVNDSLLIYNILKNI